MSDLVAQLHEEIARLKREHEQAVEDWGRNDEQVLAENQRLADENVQLRAKLDGATVLPRDEAIRRAVDIAEAAVREDALRGAGGFVIVRKAVHALANAGLLAPATSDGMYEDDEPVGQVTAAFERGVKVTTAPDTSAAPTCIAEWKP